MDGVAANGEQSPVNFVLEIKWRLRITDAETLFNF